MHTRSFEFQEGTSNKFWTISLDGSRHAVRFGRTGTNGQEQVKEFASADAAQKPCEKLIAEKIKKGYHEVAPAAAAMELAIVVTFGARERG